MKHLAALLILIAAQSLSFGQEYNDVVKLDIFGDPADAQNQMYINMMNRSKTMSDVGETNLYPEWQALEATGADGDVFAIDSANYNYSTDQFFFVYKNKPYFLSSAKTKKVKVGTDVFEIYPFVLDKQQAKGYFQVLVDGDMSLLKRTYLKKVVTNDHPMKIPQANKTHFEKAAELYYFDTKTEMAEKLPKSKKKFINLFRQRQAKLIRFAEEQKLSTHNESDMIRFFQFNKMINAENNQ